MYEAFVSGNMAESQCATTTGELSSKAVNYCDRMFDVWEQEMSGYSPQEQKQIGQCLEKLASAVSQLPHEITPPRRWMENTTQGKKSKRAIHFCLMSDSQRYKMLGNAVSVPIVKMVFERFICQS